jgi:hypothetical protein
LSLTTLILSKFKQKFEEFIDPLFWLTQNIDRIVESRQENNVNCQNINIIKRTCFTQCNFNKVTRRDFTQLLIEAESEYYKENNSNKIDLNKIRVEKKMSLDVNFFYILYVFLKNKFVDNNFTQRKSNLI